MTQVDTTTTWRLTDLHHIGLTVSDIEASIAFYQGVLGMTLVGRRPRVDAGYVAKQTGYDGVELSVASFKVSPESNQSLEIVQYLNHAGPPSDQSTNRSGNSHLCFLVSSVQECYNDLTSKGVRFKSDPVAITSGPNKGGMVVYFFDPDGHALELFQPPKH